MASAAGSVKKDVSQMMDFKNERCIAKSQTDQLAVMYAQYLQALNLEIESEQQGSLDERQKNEDLAHLMDMTVSLFEELLQAEGEMQNLQHAKILRNAIIKQSELLVNVNSWLRAAQMRKQLTDQLDERRHCLRTKGISALSEQQNRELIGLLTHFHQDNVDIFGGKRLHLRKNLDDLKLTVEEEISLFNECKELLLEVEKLSATQVYIQIQRLLCQESYQHKARYQE